MARPPTTLRDIVPIRAGTARPPARKAILLRAARVISRQAIIAMANGPDEFMVLATRMPNGSGTPSETMPDCSSQNASQGGGLTYWNTPYNAITKPPNTKVLSIVR